MKIKMCTLLFLTKEDQILLAMKKRGFGAGRYNGVGGKIEPGETIEQALIRECQEEIGVTPLNFWKVAEHDFMQNEGTQPWRMYVHTYFCDQWQGGPIETDEMAPQWFDVATIPYDAMWQDDIYWLPNVLKGESVYGQYAFDEQDNILSHTIEVVKTLPGIIPTIITAKE